MACIIFDVSSLYFTFVFIYRHWGQKDCYHLRAIPLHHHLDNPRIQFPACNWIWENNEDLTEILQSADRALKRWWCISAYGPLHEEQKYISIVNQKHKAVDSVEDYSTTSPHFKPVDCSLLKALVEAAGVEQAIQRLDEYLHMTNSCLLGMVARKCTHHTRWKLSAHNLLHHLMPTLLQCL